MLNQHINITFVLLPHIFNMRGAVINCILIVIATTRALL